MCKHIIGTAYMACNHGQSITVKGVKIPCNMWTCPECAKRKSIILGNRVSNGFEDKRIRFATLTCRKGLSLVGQLKSLKASWNRLRLILRRYYGLKTFFWVLEFGHEKGRPHLHLLLDVYVPQRRLSKLAWRCGFGEIVDIREVKSGKGFGYVYKYLGKDCGSPVACRVLRMIGARRYGTSRNIPPAPKATDGAVCVDYVMDALSQVTMNERTSVIAHALGIKDFTVTKKGSLVRFEGTSKYNEELLDTVISWAKCGIIQRNDFIAMGGYVGCPEGARWLSAQRARSGLLDDVPF